MVTKSDVKRVLDTTIAIADAIRDLGEVPSGHLYAQVMGKMSINSYNAIIECLINAKVVRRDSSHLLTWIGPKFDATTGRRL